MSLLPRVVLDTSTLVSAALRPGLVPAQAMARALAAYELCGSQTTLAELDQVMRRPKFDRYLPLADRLDFAALVQRYTRLYEVPESVLPGVTACRYPKDMKFLALALACEAHVLVSSDADLLCLQPFHGIQVLAPAAFVSHEAFG